MGEEKQQGENRTGNGSAQSRHPVSGRSSIYGSKESQQMMKRSAQHSAQARRVQTGEEKRAVSGYEKCTESEGVSARPERKKVSGSLSISENGNAPKKSRKYASEEQKAGSSKKTESEGSAPRPHIGSHKLLIRCLWGLGGVMLIVYIAVAVYFSSHFYEDTEIYGIDCSQKSVEEVKKLVADKLDEYRLEVKERGGASEYLSADQIDLKFVDNSSIDRMAKAQRSYLWPIMLMMERDDMAGVAFSYDQKKALTAFKDLECMNPIYTKAPTDAYVQVTDSGFEVVKETEGNTLNPETTAKALYAALDGGKSVLDLEEEDCYLKPDLYSDDEALVAEAEAKDALVQADITYEFGSRQERVNAPVIAQWITQAADGSYVIDDVEVTEYVESLAAKYDTFGLPRQFYTSLGTTVTLTDGDYGWCMDQDATVVDLLNALESGYQGTMEPQYTYTAMSREENDIGDTYVEICISQQVMWCYKDGVCIVYTPVVTGNPNKGNATPSNGVWSIDAKMQNYTLVGEGYRSPVDFWMPFNGNVGIHDMQTRAYFGGTIYLTNGSHGCVNTPYENAKTIYENVSIGTPVIVYD
ncbi:MAG: peptidoglycan binding domain-containing protein [Lachnospiraceae bacterium]|nr:peptidoglycan binding domain-containing protein [Lachnospiraceae bacterium]